ncbi:16S rRNA (cytidine(1402)-2'-O)-methyltransferase [Synechocystis sp. LKSZ1]|uniref:16S rRNA (cytidine(1402)-2'-O)-methyltransferase n=1 Tax=Synechocystis sp. LKSZ1 TaxID=3144951 RepID=UPI00336BE317
MGQLYLVPTPIGNLEDMTFRAIRVLQSVELIASEDTRHTGKLLQHFQITTPQISYHDHNRQSRLPQLLAHLQAGKSLALVTDAGTPGISDPGADLVQACLAQNLEVIPLPGATALIPALIASGLTTERFVFEGFLPPKGQARETRLLSLRQEQRTTILYEAPHRLLTTLVDLEHHLGPERAIVTARELTKLHEQFWRGNLGQALIYYQDQEPRGEFVLVLAGVTLAEQPLLSEQQLKAELQALIQQGLSRSQASRELAQLTQLPRRQLYQLSLDVEA